MNVCLLRSVWGTIRCACSTKYFPLPLSLLIDVKPFGNSQRDVPKGQLKIAQRFNAGATTAPGQVPTGRLKEGARGRFSRPFGTRIGSTTFPTLKRRAILGSSLRDTVRRISERHYSQWRFSRRGFDESEMRSGRRTAAILARLYLLIICRSESKPIEIVRVLSAYRDIRNSLD